MSRFCDIVMLRTGPHENLLAYAQASDVPVINGLTAAGHPCQILADLMTFEEHKGPLEGRRIAWFGDGNNVAVSLASPQRFWASNWLWPCRRRLCCRKKFWHGRPTSRKITLCDTLQAANGCCRAGDRLLGFNERRSQNGGKTGRCFCSLSGNERIDGSWRRRGFSALPARLPR